MSQLRAIPAAFLDRDGVLNHRIMDGYVTCLAELEILPHVAEAAQRLQAAGYALVVVTNQRGIARGLMSRDDVDRVNAALAEHLALVGAPLAGVYVCPHDRDEGCGCRKPAPGMLLAAARELNLDLGASLLIGDSETDIGAAEAAGVPRRYRIESDGDLREALEAFGIP